MNAKEVQTESKHTIQIVIYMNLIYEGIGGEWVGLMHAKSIKNQNTL